MAIIHADGCVSPRKSKIPAMLEQAKTRGYGQCGICKPPKYLRMGKRTEPNPSGQSPRAIRCLWRLGAEP